MPDRQQSTIAITDATAARIEELQYEFGEGPHWTALRTARPVLVDDVRSHLSHEWPMFGGAIRDIPVGALFAIPLIMGAVVIGVVDLYRDTPGWLRPRDIATAMSLAAAVTGPAARLAVDSAARESPAETATAPALRREVHQATGMILAQLNVSATDAFERLAAHAFSTERPLLDVARDVVARTLDLSELDN